MDYLKSIFDTHFMPHGHCFLWTPDILWLHLSGDIVTATAYYLIPFALIYFVRKRKRLPYPSIFIMFGIFILACGTTHILGVITLWYPYYRLEGWIKVATALASIGTTVVLYPAIPKMLKLRSPEELEGLVAQLAVKNSELETERESFRNIVERDKEGILVLSGDEVIVFANQASSEYLGGNPSSPVGTKLRYPAQAGSICELEVGEGEVRKAAEMWVSETQWEGRPARLVHLRDITTRKRAEEALQQSQEKLQQSQKMEAIGQLAGGIAHDFNNLLTVINGFTSVSLAKLPEASPIRNELVEVAKAGERASQLTGQLLAFSRKQILAPRSVDLNRVVADIGKMIRRIIGEDVSFETRLAEGLPNIRMDPGQLEQVILNLAVNARDAMPDGGELLLETAQVAFSHGMIGGREGIQPGDYAMLAVSDKGEGMSPEVKARLFEPFFTTKPQGKGTGLGLSMVYGIVKQSEGHILVFSEPGKGSTFKLYFPLAPAGEAVPAKAADSSSASRPRCETILVVEDEGSVRKLVSEVLASSRYTVLSADSGEAALALAAAHGEPVHLLLTDVIMRDIGGSEVARRLSTLLPGVKVLYMSGFTDDAIIRNGILNASSSFIQKPFTPSQLLAKVGKVLSAGDDPPETARDSGPPRGFGHGSGKT